MTPIIELGDKNIERAVINTFLSAQEGKGKHERDAERN